MTDTAAKEPLRLKDRLEAICTEMVNRKILFKEAVEQFEKCFIYEVVARNGDNLTRSAVQLGIHRNTLAKRLASFQSRRR